LESRFQIYFCRVNARLLPGSGAVASDVIMFVAFVVVVVVV